MVRRLDVGRGYGRVPLVAAFCQFDGAVAGCRSGSIPAARRVEVDQCDDERVQDECGAANEVCHNRKLDIGLAGPAWCNA